MDKKTIIWTVIITAIVILCGTGCSRYNDMVESEQSVEQAWGNVQSAYQRRSDLIPNLVNTVKGYAEHESTTLESVTAARTGLFQASQAADSAMNNNTNQGSEASMKQMQQAQSALKSALNLYVNAVREAYPDLKANTNFLDLQTQLEQTENRISTERKRYNDAVMPYNTMIRKFPNNLLAGIFGFDKKPYYEAEVEAQSAPEVKF